MCSAPPTSSRQDLASPERRAVLRALGGLGLLAAGPALAALPEPPLTHILSRVEPRKPAPEFSLPDTDGKPHKLSDYQGKVVMLNFWATWCPPCRREMPSMEKLHLAMQGKPFQILACNQQESEDTVWAFTALLKPEPTFPILLDSHSNVSAEFNVAGLPTTLIVDKQGKIAYRAVGGREFDHPDVIALLDKLIAE